MRFCGSHTRCVIAACLQLIVSVGCAKNAPSESGPKLPTAPEPVRGAGKIQLKDASPAIAGIIFYVEGSFSLIDPKRTPAPVFVHVVRVGDPLAIIQQSGMTRAIRDGDRWKFECKLSAPADLGEYEVLVKTDKYELAREKLTVVKRR